MAGPLGSKLPLECSRGLPLAAWRFPFDDFGLPRTGSSSTVYPSNLDSLCSSSGISSSSAWALGLIWNGSEPLNPLAPQQPLKILLLDSSDGEEGFDVLRPISWPVESCPPMGARAFSPAQGTFLAFQRMRCTVINTFIGRRESLRYTECVFNGAFMKRRGFGGWRFPWELGEIYFAWHSLFELCARWTPPDFVFYIRRPRRTIFHIC